VKSSDIIALVSLIVSAAALIYTYLTNTKKYELTSQYRNEIIKWYNETMLILVSLRINTANNSCTTAEKCILLSKLSTQIEVGRFYFPNINKQDGFGEEKPSAYRGYRNLALDFLVFSYRLFEEENAKDYLDHAEVLQRHFTSIIFEIVEPTKFINDTKKYTSRTFVKELSYENFIVQEPELIEKYL